MPHDRYQPVQELVDRLEVAEATCNGSRDRELRAIDVGKGWRIADANLEGFLKARETVPRKWDDKKANIAEPGL